VEIVLSLHSCALFVGNFNRANKDPPSATAAAILPEKTPGLRPVVFSSLNLRVPDLTLPNYLMTMWLP